MINGGKKVFLVLSLFGIACVYQVFVRMYPYDTRHFTSNHNTLCDDNCAESEDGHYRCNTNEGKDYCSPDNDVASNGKPCLEDHPCDQHGTNYHWCYTGKTTWDFCGLVDGSAVGYIRGASHRRYKRKTCPTNYSGDHTCDERKVFFEYECDKDKNNQTFSGDNVNCISKVIEYFQVEKLPTINDLQQSVVETGDKECCILFEGKYISKVNQSTITYYKLHVQDKNKTKTYATVYVPSNETNYLKNKTIRYAFNQSSKKKQKITMVIKYSPGSGKRCRAAPKTSVSTFSQTKPSVSTSSQTKSSVSTSSQTKPRKTTLYLASVVMVSTFFL